MKVSALYKLSKCDTERKATVNIWKRQINIVTIKISMKTTLANKRIFYSRMLTL